MEVFMQKTSYTLHAAVLSLILMTPLIAKPQIALLATGGTIAGAGKSSTSSQYTAAVVPVTQLIADVPEISTLATIHGEQVCQLSSQAMTPEMWVKIGKQTQAQLDKNDIVGAIITHGTDTMEETAYFLQLTLQTEKPVVLVGSMRPGTALGADGAANLYQAVKTVIAPNSHKRGVMVLMNDTLFSAREVTKRHPVKPSAFESPNTGPIGGFHDNTPNYLTHSERTETPFSIRKLSVLPGVAIIYGYAGSSAAQVRAAVQEGARGIVLAGVGNGNLNPDTEKALISARQDGIIVVRSSRVGSGSVTKEAEVDDAKHGFIVAGSLNPQKARVLLMLALTQTVDLNRIQGYFDTL
jgi:L-asparaginase